MHFLSEGSQLQPAGWPPAAALAVPALKLQGAWNNLVAANKELKESLVEAEFKLHQAYSEGGHVSVSTPIKRIVS